MIALDPEGSKLKRASNRASSAAIPRLPSVAEVAAESRMHAARSAADHLVAEMRADDQRDVPLISEPQRRELHARVLRHREEADHQEAIVRKERGF